jgi:hypothetical protein
VSSLARGGFRYVRAGKEPGDGGVGALVQLAPQKPPADRDRESVAA